jgi:hypothetical protein
MNRLVVETGIADLVIAVALLVLVTLPIILKNECDRRRERPNIRVQSSALPTHR